MELWEWTDDQYTTLWYDLEHGWDAQDICFERNYSVGEIRYRMKCLAIRTINSGALTLHDASVLTGMTTSELQSFQDWRNAKDRASKIREKQENKLSDTDIKTLQQNLDEKHQDIKDKLLVL